MTPSLIAMPPINAILIVLFNFFILKASDTYQLLSL